MEKKQKIIPMTSTNTFTCSPLVMKRKFIYNNMVRFDTIADGSCFFHAVLMSFYEPYQLNNIDRISFVREFRRDLAKTLSSPINPNDGESPSYYDALSGGTLSKFAESVPQYSLSKMVKILDSNSFVGNEYIEYISNLFSRDIYILDIEKSNVYMTGDEYGLLYKNRQSTVIGYKNSHFELIGVQSSNGHIRVGFSPDDPFISYINKTMENNMK
uniref:OTU-like cysteine protease n=1 Tax=Pithovirus LCPAC101 TaxID=2506586 RepID=A0A481Z2U3_9VIRU|nr:MAG: OTU-like cysteine protease [Pithovirus LCPAC101]